MTTTQKIEMPTVNNRMGKYELYLIMKKHAAMCGYEINYFAYQISKNSKKHFIEAIKNWVNQYNNNIDKANEAARKEAYLKTLEGKAKLLELEQQKQDWENKWKQFKTNFNNQLSAIFSRANIDHIKLNHICDNGFELSHEDSERPDWYALNFSYSRSWLNEPSEMVVNTTSYGGFNPNKSKELANRFILQGLICSKPEIFKELIDLFDSRSAFAAKMSKLYDEIEKSIKDL